VLVNDKTVTPELAESTAQMILPLPAGTERVRMRFLGTPDRVLGNIVSILAVLTTLACIFVVRAPRWNNQRATYLFFPLLAASCSSTLLRSSFTSERVALRKPV
jgi:hypothetical protein